jgi:hypothetical protein
MIMLITVTCISRRMNVLTKISNPDNLLCFFSESMFAKKVVLINILEDTMNSSKVLIQKPVNIILVPSIEIFCVAMSILINLIRNQKFVVGLSFEVNKQSLDAIMLHFPT